MADDIEIVFTADISDLQRGLSQATSGVADVTATLRAGAQQVTTSFAATTDAYAAGFARRLDLVKAGSDEELSIARSGDRAATDIALDGIKVKQDQVKEEARLSLLSHDDERSQLLALEADREAIERGHLEFLQSTYKDNATAFASTQRQIDELAAQSALKRQQIEQSYTREVYADYKRTFEQVGSSVSTQIVGIIKGPETLRQAVSNVLLSIVQSFIQARIRSVADWLAGVVTETTATTAGEATKTTAVLAGTTARTAAQQTATTATAATTLASIGESIIASAAETFAGIFGFLSPVLGPAAAGPAVAGQATVLAAGSALPSFATGAWSLPADMVAQVHRGEMIVPAGPAAQIRDAAASGGSGVQVHHQTHFNVTAMDSRDVSRFLRGNSRAIMGAINDSVRKGAHLGLSRIGG